jgi:hypothetical protein
LVQARRIPKEVCFLENKVFGGKGKSDDGKSGGVSVNEIRCNETVFGETFTGILTRSTRDFFIGPYRLI